MLGSARLVIAFNVVVFVERSVPFHNRDLKQPPGSWPLESVTARLLRTLTCCNTSIKYFGLKIMRGVL